MRSRERETRVVVVEGGRLPLQRPVAPPAIRAPGTGRELPAVDIHVAFCALSGRRVEYEFPDSIRRALRVVAFRAWGAAMGALKGKQGGRMAELGHIPPRLLTVARIAAGGPALN